MWTWLRQLFGLSKVRSLPEVARIEVARLRPSDILVVELKRIASAKQVDMLQAQLKPFFPDNKVLICDDGTRLRCLGVEDAAEIIEEGSEV